MEFQSASLQTFSNGLPHFLGFLLRLAVRDEVSEEESWTSKPSCTGACLITYCHYISVTQQSVPAIADAGSGAWG
jgi:hypothetical protein